MDNLEDDVARVTASLIAAKAELARLGARVEGLRAEREALVQSRTSMSFVDTDTQGILGMSKADAIVAVLEAASPQPLRAGSIVDALHAAGRKNEIPQRISVYLDGLLKQGRVARVARGEYSVPS